MNTETNRTRIAEENGKRGTDMNFFETASALLHDLGVLGALAAWPFHGAFMAVLGLFSVAFENIGGFITGMF